MQDSITLKEVSKLYRRELGSYYTLNEIESLIYLIYGHIFKFDRLKVHMNGELILSGAKLSEALEILDELKAHKPIQYILGKTMFYDLPFKVTNDVLIPRPETEELVKWVIDENKGKHLNIIDIGTGSGCIAVSLAKYLSQCNIFGVDNSATALEVAKENALMNQVSINFSILDIHSDNFPETRFPLFDIIISNPPYVLESEKESMQRHVIHFEPHQALFVQNDHPLEYYSSITRFALKFLKTQGSIFVEINESMGLENINLFKHHGFLNCILKKDINAKHRMIKATR